MTKQPAGSRRYLMTSLLALFAFGADADVLVLRDGGRVETRGAWQEKGRQVVFTDAQGKLCALRQADVDLEASRTATARAAAPVPASPVVVDDRPVVLVLDENDLGLGTDPDPDEPDRAIVLYATSWCGWCRKTRALFAELGVAYEERDVEASSAYRLERNRLTGGDSGVPVVDWRGETVRGFAEARFRALAQADRAAAAEKERQAAQREGETKNAERESSRPLEDSAGEGEDRVDEPGSAAPPPH